MEIYRLQVLLLKGIVQLYTFLCYTARAQSCRHASENQYFWCFFNQELFFSGCCQNEAKRENHWKFVRLKAVQYSHTKGKNNPHWLTVLCTVGQQWIVLILFIYAVPVCSEINIYDKDTTISFWL